MKGEFYVCTHSDVTFQLKDIGSSHVLPYISPPTVMANFTKKHLSFSLERQYGQEKLRRRLKFA